jgi:hypothetical protein
MRYGSRTLRLSERQRRCQRGIGRCPDLAAAPGQRLGGARQQQPGVGNDDMRTSGLTRARRQDDRERITLAIAGRAGVVSLAPAAGGRVAVRLTGHFDASLSTRPAARRPIAAGAPIRRSRRSRGRRDLPPPQAACALRRPRGAVAARALLRRVRSPGAGDRRADRARADAEARASRPWPEGRPSMTASSPSSRLAVGAGRW